VYTTTPIPAPIIGALISFDPNALQFGSIGYAPSGLALNWNSAIPSFNFPKFDGRNSETFFDVYSVPENLWVKLPTMNFSGSASLWVQTVPGFACNHSWKDLCSTICSKFDRDEHNHLQRKFSTLSKLVLLLSILKPLVIHSISYLLIILT